MPVRVVIADDHPLLLDGVESLLCRAGDFEVASRCGSGREALRAVREHEPDLLVIDLKMPDMGGMDVLRQLRAEGRETRVTVLTAAIDEDEVLEAIRLGVRGVVLKEMAPTLLVQCLRKIHAGGQWLEKESVGRALDRLLQRESEAGKRAGVLSPKEQEVVGLVSQGLRNREIADRLFVTEGTVKVHLHNIYEKLELDGRMALMLWAGERGRC